MTNTVPTFTGLNAATFLENSVNASPQFIDTDITFTDADGNFGGSMLTISGLLPEDVVSIHNQGTGAGQIGFANGLVTYEGTVIGFAGGGVGNTLFVSFLPTATAAAIETVIQNLTYANSSDAPTASRTLDVKFTDPAAVPAAAPAFTERTGSANPFSGVDIEADSAPTFADLDGDGDLDLLVAGFEGGAGDHHYFKNNGTAIAPSFELQTGSDNPFPFGGVPGHVWSVSADLDGDGAVDILAGTSDGDFSFFPNTGTANAPFFGGASTNPFGLSFVFQEDIDGDGRPDVIIGDADTAPAPCFADLDGDGDLDAVVGRSDGTLAYFKNVGSASSPNFVWLTDTTNPFDGLNVGASATPAFADIDRDGDLDAVVGEAEGTLNYFENIGTATAPSFVQRTGAANPFDGFTVGSASTPTFADINGDGCMDIVVGSADGALHYPENTAPAAVAPDFIAVTGASNPFNGVDLGSVSAASFADLDGDGDLDAFVGASDGTINYFENVGSATASNFVQGTGAANPFNAIDVGNDAKVSFADLDADGDLDALAGNSAGTWSYFANIGSAMPTFAAAVPASTFGIADVVLSAAPSFVDLDADGDLDVVAGQFDGTLRYFKNVGSAISPDFDELTGAANPFTNIDVGTNSTPTFADLDDDGDLDAVVGTENGTLNYFENIGSGIDPNFVQRTGAANPFNGFDVGNNSTPSFADLDGDGDLDAIVGNSDGTLNYYRNTGSGFALVVNVTPENDPGSAADDAFTTAEDTALTNGNVFADNGSGTDSDPDLALAVTAVNGDAASVGTQITLPSGALLTLNADGTFSYDPNGAFDHLPAPGSGASNTAATDNFTYTLNGGDSATVTITITGVDSSDTLLGTSGDDTLLGGDGYDTLIGGAGADHLVGGDSDDTASYANASAGVVADLSGTLVQTGDAAGDTYDGIENLVGSDFDDVLAGKDDVNYLAGGGGNDTIYVGPDDSAFGDAGDDLIIADGGGNPPGFNIPAFIDGGDGTDTVRVVGDTMLIGVMNVERFEIAAGANADLSNVFQFDPTYTINLLGAAAVIGTGNNDTINGSSGNDTIGGGDGDDTIIAGAGDDLLLSGPGIDSYDGGGGIDTLSFAHLQSPFAANVDLLLANGILNDGDSSFNESITGVENLIGGGAADFLRGDNGANRIEGGAGGDRLLGRAGNDMLVGGSGNDILTGGDGDDTLIGGTGGDRAVFSSTLSNYTVVRNGILTTVQDNSGADGHDVVNGVEKLDFTDVDLRDLAFTGDFDGDGRADIALQNGNASALWLMDGTAVQAGSGNTATLGEGWSILGAGDFNHDGNDDFVLQNGQQLAIWQMDGTSFAAGGGNIAETLDPGWMVTGIADFTGDGRSDLLLQNGQDLQLRAMDGTTVITHESGSIGTLGSGWCVAGTGDFTGDGKADILLQNGQQLALWAMDGTTLLPGSGNIAPLNAGWMVAGVADATGDGRADILLQNGQDLALWAMNGTSVLAGSGNIGTLGDGWTLAGNGDFNNDGRADLLLQNGQMLAEWLLDGTALQAGSGNVGPLGAGWDLL